MHWQELPLALYPDHLGTLFSGSAVIDYQNTAGFNQGKTPPMVALYTADNPEKQVQCVAYSLDKGRTWIKYAQNSVIDSKAKWNTKDTRNPRVFWYQPLNHWVMVLNERDGHSIYTSPNLKDWQYLSHVTGFWECPDLFVLPTDGNKNNTKWVMLGASNTYMLGSFNGKTFTPESGKHYFSTGSIYAAQTYANIPDSDGRCIQLGWGRITQPNMLFNKQMLLPTELTLRTTKNGVCLFSVPIKEIEAILTPVQQAQNITAAEANQQLQQFNPSDRLRLKATIQLSHASSAGLNLFGQRLLDYDLNANLVNNDLYSPPNITSTEITADIYLNRTSVEVFIDNGAYSYSMARQPDSKNQEGFHFWGNNIQVKNLEVYSGKSIWQ